MNLTCVCSDNCTYCTITRDVMIIKMSQYDDTLLHTHGRIFIAEERNGGTKVLSCQLLLKKYTHLHKRPII